MFGLDKTEKFENLSNFTDWKIWQNWKFGNAEILIYQILKHGKFWNIDAMKTGWKMLGQLHQQNFDNVGNVEILIFRILKH